MFTSMLQHKMDDACAPLLQQEQLNMLDMPYGTQLKFMARFSSNAITPIYKKHAEEFKKLLKRNHSVTKEDATVTVHVNIKCLETNSTTTKYVRKSKKVAVGQFKKSSTLSEVHNIARESFQVTPNRDTFLGTANGIHYLLTNSVGACHQVKAKSKKAFQVYLHYPKRFEDIEFQNMLARTMNTDSSSDSDDDLTTTLSSSANASTEIWTSTPPSAASLKLRRRSTTSTTFS